MSKRCKMLQNLYKMLPNVAKRLKKLQKKIQDSRRWSRGLWEGEMSTDLEGKFTDKIAVRCSSMLSDIFTCMLQLSTLLNPRSIQ